MAFTEREAWKLAVGNEPFADSKIDVEDIVCEGDKVVVRYRLECTQVRPLFGVSPSDRRITTSGTKIYRVRGDKIAEIAGHDDFLGVLHQLGVVEIDLSSPPSAADSADAWRRKSRTEPEPPALRCSPDDFFPRESLA